jgi:hypothetical protein
VSDILIFATISTSNYLLLFLDPVPLFTPTSKNFSSSSQICSALLSSKPHHLSSPSPVIVYNDLIEKLQKPLVYYLTQE